ncbi:hypothetical protein WN944_014631 [Citrus x changshan-huyou]|uniref:Uncharacterized protein n=1 Tax=Citrus x changshan-huyou TaxID=2935761 RepID=A0AAP0MCG1_9ROSI
MVPTLLIYRGYTVYTLLLLSQLLLIFLLKCITIIIIFLYYCNCCCCCCCCCLVMSLLLLFLIIILLSLINVCIFTYDRGERSVELFVVPLKPAAEIDWFDLADENEFALLDLNDEVHIEQVTAIEDSLERMPAN